MALDVYKTLYLRLREELETRTRTLTIPTRDPNLQPPMNPFLAVFLQSIVSSLVPVLTQAGTEGIQLLEAELGKVVSQKGLPHINTAAPGASTQPVSSSSAS